MKINFSYIPQIKNNYTNKTNLRFNNALASDVFERKNISFGKKNTQSPKEILIKHKGFSESQADIILSIGNISLANEITSLMKNGYDFNFAIDEIVKNNFLPKADDFMRYQNLSADCELDIIDRITIIVYELNDEQVARYKAIKDKFTQQYEAILAVKFDLSDDEVAQYLSNKNTCELSIDELMICIKEKFDNKQLTRFTELKNRKKSFENQTARKQEEQQAYPIRYIITCVKEGKADEDIEREDRLLNLNPVFCINSDFAVKLLMMSDGDYKAFLDILKKSNWSVEDYAKYIYNWLTNISETAKYSQISLSEYLTKNGDFHCSILPDKLEECAKLLEKSSAKLQEIYKNPEEIEKKYNQYCDPFSDNEEQVEKQIDEFSAAIHHDTREEIHCYAVKFAEMSEEDFKYSIRRFKELYKYMTKTEALELAALTEKEYSRYEALISSGYHDNVRFRIAKFSETEKNSFDAFIKEGYNADIASKLVTMKPEDLQKFKELKEKDLFSQVCYIDGKTKDLRTEFGDWARYYIARLPDETYKKLSDFLLSEEKYNTLGLDFKKYVIYSPILSQLSESQMDRFKQFYSDGYKIMDAVHVAILNSEQYDYFCELREAGESVLTACLSALSDLSDSEENYFKEIGICVYPEDYSHLYNLTFEQANKLKKIPIMLSKKQALALVKTTNLTFATSELLEKLPDDFWYKINTGSEKEAHEIIQKAIAELLLEQRGESSSLNLTPFNNIQFYLEKPGYGENHVYYSKNSEYSLNDKGDFELQTAHPFAINLSQGLINQKPIMVVKDKNSDSRYVSYNGAIARVKPIENHDSAQFETWGNILPQKQAEVLVKAADEFVFNLFDRDGNCIIGQNASKLNIVTAKDDEIESFYSDKLLALKENNSLNAQEILKLMPKDCMLTISPYIQEADFKYAIVCEWFSKDGNRWQMEIHSQDSKWNNDEKWIFRLHKQTLFGRQYFQFVDNNEGFNFNGGTLDGNAHIKIPTPLEENDLLNNVEFQTIIKQISIQQYKDFGINKIANNLKVGGQNNEEKIQNIINHCLTHPLDFARYKDVILKLRASLGMVELV